MNSPTTERPSVARRQYLIDRRFQLKYTALVVALGAALSLAFGVMMYLAHRETTELLALPDPLRDSVVDYDGRLLWLTMGIAVVMAVALALFGVLVTHRIAGPIYFFTRCVDVLGRGGYPQLRPLRRGDELKSFYDTFQAAVEAMRERDARRAAELGAIADALEAAGQGGAADALHPACARLREMSQRLADAAASARAAPVAAESENGAAG